MVGEMGARRAVLASCLVVLIVFSPVLVDWGIARVQRIARAADVVFAGDALDGQDLEISKDLPDWFSQELVLPNGAFDVLVAAGGDVIGFQIALPPEQVMKEMEQALSNKGWLYLSSGIPTCETFLKEEGQRQWAFISCTDMGSTTSVVVRSASTRKG